MMRWSVRINYLEDIHPLVLETMRKQAENLIAKNCGHAKENKLEFSRDVTNRKSIENVDGVIIQEEIFTECPYCEGETDEWIYA